MANSQTGKDENEGGKFDAGKMIMHHVKDAYEWHITKIGQTEVTIPLPVILYSSNKGFQVFSSAKFQESESYNNFKIAHEGKYEGRIVEILPDGKESRPLDLSITKNVLAVFLSIILIIWLFLSIAKKYSENYARAPKGTQSWIEPIILFIRDDVAKAAIGNENYRKYLPYLLTIFFFILINNLLGLIPFFPGGANVTGNISVTLALALFTFIITQFSGSKDYWTHLINAPGVPWWLKLPVPLMPIVEIMGVFIKPFVLMIRLFANICAGHIIALGFYSLIFIFGQRSLISGYGVSVVSVAFTIFMGLLELLVAFIQAYVFTLLSAIYFGMAIEKHHNHEEEKIVI
jgi:F-type H+-transporting ATPase subunit a